MTLTFAAPVQISKMTTMQATGVLLMAKSAGCSRMRTVLVCQDTAAKAPAMMYPSKTPATMRSVENQMLFQNVCVLDRRQRASRASSGPQSKMPLLSSMLATCHTTSQKATGAQRVRACTPVAFLSIDRFLSMGQLAASKGARGASYA